MHRRAPPTLFSRTLRLFLAALAVLLGLLAAGVVLAVAVSARGWTRDRSDEVGSFLESLVLATYRSQGRLDAESIAASTLPYLDDSTYLFVFAPGGELVFGWRRGERLEGGQGRSFLTRHADTVEPRDLVDRGTVIGRVAAGVLSFSDEGANRGFLGSLALVGGLGALVSFGLALALAWLFSSRLSRQSIQLAAGLGRLASGERGVPFGTGGPRELAEIGRSALALQEKLSREETVRRRWAADVAHDLRTPVAALKAQIEGMSDGVLEPTAGRLAQVSEELARVETLVDDLGELSRMESPDLRIESETVSAQSVVEALRSRFALEAGRRQIALECGADPVLLRADPRLLDRALGNLVQNALQHASRGGRVRIRVTGRPEGGVALEVENTGKVAEADLPHVFDRLYRGEASRHTPGSGLGLSITRAIVERHGGTIKLTNTDRGSVLATVTLPGA